MTIPERVLREPETVLTVVVRVERLELVVARFPESERRLVFVRSRDPESVLTRPERVAMFPVAVARFVVRVARFVFVVARFPERVPMLPVAVARLVMREVLVPWSFWIAVRRESLAMTVPAPAENPVRGVAMTRAFVK